MMRLLARPRKAGHESRAMRCSGGKPGHRIDVRSGLSFEPAAALGLTLFLSLGLAACGETITKHGHHFQENDLKQVTNGMSQEQVKAALGTPTTTATVGQGSAYYYISSTQGQTSFFKPVEKDRKVLAIYFNQLGSVDRVAHYGIKDGKVFDFARQSTPTPSRDEGILKALFRNLGAKQFGTVD
jgi:outer membrane protein assembly factor BamE (lipoprotein component of BamABCDE complex)